MKKFIISVLAISFLCFSVLASSLAIPAAYAANVTGVGKIKPPPGVDKWQPKAQAQGADIGIVYFMSNMIKLFSVVMGIWVLYNGVLAGYLFLNSSGDASAFEKARTQITQSVIGLLMIMLAYTFTGLIGLIFFGDAAIFLNPTIPAAP